MRWLVVQVDLLAAVTTSTTAFLVVALHGVVAPAMAGLALSYAWHISGILSHTTRLISETETRFISVERILAYVKSAIPEGNSKTIKPPLLWPNEGQINMSNLDRKNEYSERELRDVLAKTMLLDRVSAMPLKLNSDVGTGSTSLSVGECQLLCLARVLLKNSKVLILDEATASIDPETEAAVKSTIQREFKDCTVLVIVHRLSTITNCNRILVMEEGEVIELDTPGELLANTNSTFARMMAASDASLRT